MAVSHLINYKSSVIHYLQIGEGPKTLIAFHGFGDNAKLFNPIRPAIESQFTLYAIDLPYHGKTNWLHQDLFSRQDIVEIIHHILEEEKIDRFSLMGYSLGGKVSLSMVEFFANKMAQLILLAPDGVRTHPLYNLATYPSIGRKLFKYIVDRPSAFFTLVKSLYKLRLISKFLFEFTMNHMDTYEKRIRLYNIWVSLCDFIPKNYKIKKILNQHKVKVHLFFGLRDEIIRPKAAHYFKTGLDYVDLTFLSAGHLIVNKKLNFPLSKSLNRRW